MNYLKTYFLLLSLLLISSSCTDLNLDPLSEPATGNFYSSQKELELAVNDLNRAAFFGNDDESWTDNMFNRGGLGNPITFGTIDAGWGPGATLWNNSYKAIARVNTFLEKMGRAEDTPESVLTKLEAEVRFIRAYQYSRLITHFGDVPFYTDNLDLEESYTLGRTDKSEIVDFIYSELEWAADNLPESYTSGELKRHTKGDALAIKARTALYEEDYKVASEAAQAVMDLGVYELYPNYRDLFLHEGETSSEIMMSIPRSEELDEYSSGGVIRAQISRNAGGFGSNIPTWSLMDSYECIDGDPIDESPLYNPQEPFENRDPRLSMTIVEFGTRWLNYIYQPHPDSTEVYSFESEQYVTNQDTRSVTQYASYTGLLWKKGVDQTWVDGLSEDMDEIILRYAEVLLTYAEAKIELNEVDQSVLDAINKVRARAYGVDFSQVSDYPEITSTNQEALREVIRRERRVEFAKEGLRYMDLIRWGIAEDALTQPVYGLASPQEQDRSKWPFPGTPQIDENSVPTYSSYVNDIRQLAERNFDASKQYLWPIPESEIRINDNLTQNSGY